MEPELVTETYEQILNNCENLKISGLMTIGSLADSLNTEKTNKDFQVNSHHKYIWWIFKDFLKDQIF